MKFPTYHSQLKFNNIKKSPEKNNFRNVVISMSIIYIGTFIKSGKCLNDLLNKRWCINERGRWLHVDYTSSLGRKPLLHLLLFGSLYLLMALIHPCHSLQKGISSTSNPSVDPKRGALWIFSSHPSTVYPSSWFSSKNVCTNVEFLRKEQCLKKWRSEIQVKRTASLQLLCLPQSIACEQDYNQWLSCVEERP